MVVSRDTCIDPDALPFLKAIPKEMPSHQKFWLPIFCSVEEVGLRKCACKLKVCVMILGFVLRGRRVEKLSVGVFTARQQMLDDTSSCKKFGAFSEHFLEDQHRIWRNMCEAFQVEGLILMIRVTRSNSIDRWMDRWMDGLMNGSIHPSIDRLIDGTID